MRRAPAVVPWTMCALIIPAWLIAPVMSQKYGSSLTSVAQAESRERSDPTRCVRYEQHVVVDGLRLRFENRCREAMSCNVRWTLRCEGDRERQPERRGLSLPLDQHREIMASARSCGDDRGWEIREITWRCRSDAP
jgi:tRNA(His) 5'-end guanylyltransferase